MSYIAEHVECPHKNGPFIKSSAKKLTDDILSC